MRIIARVEPKYQRIHTPATSSWLCSVHRVRFDLGLHTHPEVELTLITSGRGHRLVGDSIETYGPGDLVLIGSQLPHAYLSPPGTTDNSAIVAQFSRDFAGPEFLKMPEFAGVGRLLDRADRGLAFPADSVTSTIEHMHAFPTMNDANRTLSLIRVLLDLAQSDSAARVLSTGEPRRSFDDATRTRINEVCGYLNNAYTETISLGEMANLAHMSPTSFSRFFRQTMGRTPTAYITELRIGAACRLLIDTDLPIIEVAARSGYSNLSNFNRRFRTAKHVTPREYRSVYRRNTYGRSDPGEGDAA